MSRGPGALVKRIKVPTLILQGTPDTLFTPSEAIDNYRILRRKGVPLKMLWFCGGHGTVPDRRGHRRAPREPRRSRGSSAT